MWVARATRKLRVELLRLEATVLRPERSVFLLMLQLTEFNMTLMNSMYDVTLRFLVPQIANAIYLKYFDGIKIQGRADPGFLVQLNVTMICLTSAILYHELMALQTRIYKIPIEFKHHVV